MKSPLIDAFAGLIGSATVFLWFVVVLYVLQRMVCFVAVKKFGNKSIYLSAIIGVPVHELSHYFMCLLFGHKVSKIALFEPDGHGTLGYVVHSYNPNNVWQVFGNLFIGLAPLAGGAFAIFILTELILPNGDALIEVVLSSSESFYNVSDIQSFFAALIDELTLITQLLIESFNLNMAAFALWAYLTGAISLHLSPSSADLKGSVSGLIVLLIIVVLLQLLSADLNNVLFGSISAFLLSFAVIYSICILLSLILFVIIIFYSYLTS